jgi:probable 2-oxoglutarate dehydrogenase E1 component DHKTD1
MLCKYLVRSFANHQQKQVIYENKKISDTVILNHGHRTAFLDPLGLEKPLSVSELEDLASTSISLSPSAFLGEKFGFEISQCDIQEQNWLIKRINDLKIEKFPNEKKIQIAEAMIKSQSFDNFMQKRFGQVKRYSLEGLESLIVAINQVIEKSDKGSTLVFSMAHRGRLNILTGPIGMPLEAVFAKLRGESELTTEGSADVLSHLSINHIYNERRLIMLPNPSHLEAINPVQQGFIHALQENSPENNVIGVQIHGDGAVACQGIVQESLQLSNLEGFSCGGIIHIIGNNQLAFTADKLKKNSGRYCSDVGHIINAPIFHVNGDDPENICVLMNLAFDYRQTFKKDIFIDIVGFRRWGHNELDEPAFTQPIMYSQIRNRELPGDVYLQSLVEGKVIPGELPNWKQNEFDKLDAALSKSAKYQFSPPISEGLILSKKSEVKLSCKELREIGIKSVTIPDNFVSKISLLGSKSEINKISHRPQDKFIE